MDCRTHGGSCCGRRHIVGMSGETTDSIRRLMTINGLLEDGANKLTEIVISEENGDEDELEELRAEIEGAGFVKVAVWDNCSGSVCEMYLHANDVTYFPNGAPARNVERNIPAAAPAPRIEYRDRPRAVVRAQFHNVLRGVRSEAGWPSIESARTAAPRARRIDRCDIYNDGSVEYVEGV